MTDTERLIIAYEPVWAIGTGKTASPADAVSVHTSIRQSLRAMFSGSGDRIPILYGGSVTAENAKGLLAESAIDGVLVGGASLDPKAFAAILDAAAAA